MTQINTTRIYYKKNCNLTKQNFSKPLNTKPIDSLNQKTTIEEIKKSIKYLKTKKAPGLTSTNFV